MIDCLLKVENLKVSFSHEDSYLQVVRGFDLEIQRGEIVGIVGESGSGKTVSASSITKLIPEDVARIDSGSVIFEGKELMGLSEKLLKSIRGKNISYIFQNPTMALNPYKRIGTQLKAILNIHRLPAIKEEILDTLKSVGIENAKQVYNMFPYQLSGGLNQRVMIAECILCKPRLVIADEPTSAIDASVQRKVLDLLKEINKTYETSIMLITHDFDVAKYICDKVLIMYGGLVLEEGKVEEVFHEPLHPYTKELIKCANALDSEEDDLYSLNGMPPIPKDFSNQCPFYERCSEARNECLENIPKIIDINNRKVRCIKYEKR